MPRGTDRNYTGFLTKTIVYTGTLVLFLACEYPASYSYPAATGWTRQAAASPSSHEVLTRTITAFALTLCSIIIPRWVSYHSEKVRSSGPASDSIPQLRPQTNPLFSFQPAHHYSYGLHRRCSSLTDTCESFPQREDCHGEDRYFCSMWRSVGFLMSFAVVLEGMSIVAYLIILSGGKRLRENGWRLLSILIILSAVLQAASMSIVVGSSRGDLHSHLWYTDGFPRHTCSITRTGSSLAGSSTSLGSSAPSAGALVFFALALSSSRLRFSRPRADMSSSLIMTSFGLMDNLFVLRLTWSGCLTTLTCLMYTLH